MSYGTSHHTNGTSTADDTQNTNGIKPNMVITNNVDADEIPSVSLSINGESSIDSDMLSAITTSPSSSDDEILDELRTLLMAPEQTQIELLREDVETLNMWVDEKQLFDRMTPLVNRVIEKQIRESPEDVVELMYPLLGKMVQRAVKEAMRNLADRIDAQRQKAFSFQRLLSRFRATSNGVSGNAVDLRDALPFQVEELFLIHQESGLLLHHESRKPDGGHDSDMISAMLTAIGDFVQNAFGDNKEGELEEIEFAGKRVLIERFQCVNVAVVVDGIEPFDYRHEIRRRINAFERDNRAELQNYMGDTSVLDIESDSLRKLLFL